MNYSCQEIGFKITDTLKSKIEQVFSKGLNQSDNFNSKNHIQTSFNLNHIRSTTELSSSSESPSDVNLNIREFKENQLYATSVCNLETSHLRQQNYQKLYESESDTDHSITDFNLNQHNLQVFKIHTITNPSRLIKFDSVDTLSLLDNDQNQTQFESSSCYGSNTSEIFSIKKPNKDPIISETKDIYSNKSFTSLTSIIFVQSPHLPNRDILAKIGFEYPIEHNLINHCFYRQHFSHIELLNNPINLTEKHMVSSCVDFQNHGFILLNLSFPETIITLPFYVVDNDFVASIFISRNFSENYAKSPTDYLPFKKISFTHKTIEIQYCNWIKSKILTERCPHLTFEQIALLKNLKSSCFGTN